MGIAVMLTRFYSLWEEATTIRLQMMIDSLARRVGFIGIRWNNE
jgi:hypothetical protein